MGSIFSFPFRKQSSRNDNCTSTSSRRTRNRSLSSLSSYESSIINDNFSSRTVRDSPDSGSVNAKRASSNSKMEVDKMKQDKKSKYYYIPDNFSSLDQVTVALRESGLESSNLIIGIDFTKSNEWTGKVSFNNRSLHAIGDSQNPYEKAISIIGKTLSPFDEDNLIPCFGFGDVTTHDQDVFSFHSDHSPCHGFEEVLACYRKIVPNLQLSGPTSYGPVVDAAVDIVERTGGQYHVLVIIADGQVTRSVDTSDMELSPQEEKTINSFVTARSVRLPWLSKYSALYNIRSYKKKKYNIRLSWTWINSWRCMFWSKVVYLILAKRHRISTGGKLFCGHYPQMFSDNSDSNFSLSLVSSLCYLWCSISPNWPWLCIGHGG
ncbi:E3 ubiquitin-protein ligase RGLG4 isoform X3 [Lycium ferocissimum]|uniref:E3 ubiquitin-protein ligase RGLG4 isoform X3 n=1 Tax=Lycium ferocissimum TaxID=112874 RepID=UPI0028166CF1|nr:E3 ubiquitin-protein ligase RGLG4 isoform X3 [Lycium ferocissimum]